MRYFIALALSMLLYCTTFAQQDDSDKKVIGKFIEESTKKADQVLAIIKRENEMVLRNLEKQENKILNILRKVDSSGLSTFENLLRDQKTHLLGNLENILTEKIPFSLRGEYLPFLDSTQGLLRYLMQDNPDGNSLVANLNQLKEVQKSLNKSRELQQYLTQRMSTLKGFLENKSKRIGKAFERLSKVQADLNQYKAAIEDVKESFRSPDKLQSLALSVLRKSDKFNSFMARNSMLSSLFPGQSTPVNSDQSMGMASREALQKHLTEKLHLPINQATALSQKSVSAAKAAMGPGNTLAGQQRSLSDEQPRLTGSTKKFQFGFNVQTRRSSQVFPTLVDVAITAGYNLNKKLIIGAGISYRAGLGSSFQDISITHNGVGLRSSIDARLKKSFFLTGGLEYNFSTPFGAFRDIRSINGWQTAGLIGATKSFNIGTGLIKEMRVQLLWDFLAPKNGLTQPLLLRIGYQF